MQVSHMTHIKHQVCPQPTPPYHTPHKLTLIQHIGTRNHIHTHKLIALNSKFIRPPDFNQSVVDLMRCQTELAHSTQCLHQATTDALQNIVKSSALQENLHFIHDIPMFKAKDHNCLMNGWIAALTNNDPYKLALAKSQGSFSKTISSYPPTLCWNKIKECVHYNFGSVATKQHATSMPIDQQQKPAETLQEYFKRFRDLLLKSSGMLPH